MSNQYKKYLVKILTPGKCYIFHARKKINKEGKKQKDGGVLKSH